MGNERPPVFGEEHVNRVDTLGIHVVEPSGEDAIAAKLPMVFMRNDIVWIIRPRSIETDAAEHLPGRGQARYDTVCARAVTIGLLEQPINIGISHRSLDAVRRSDLGAR